MQNIFKDTVNFKDKVILITGASSGLGKALAIKLSHQEAKLVLAGRNLESLHNTAHACINQPLIIQTDVTCEDSCQSLIQKTIDHFGKLDYLILNAGISMRSSFHELSDLTIIEQMMKTNYLGAVYCTHHALPYLIQSQGMIVVISSIQGKIGVPYHSGYAAAKHALLGFFNTLRMELKSHHVDILTVLPGWIRDTALSQNALGKKSINKHKGIPAKQCAKTIMLGMAKRKREMIIPARYRGIPWLKLLSPRLLDYFIMRVVG